MKRGIPLLLALVMSAAACEDASRSQPTSAAILPDVVGHAIGPQPGPDAPMPRIDNPYRDDASAPAEGRRLFTWFNCEGCHGGHAGGGMGPSLRDVEWLYGNEDQDIFNSIAEGRAHGMPAWGTKVPTAQIWKLVAYIQSLDTGREPTPPPPNRSYPDPPPRE